MRYAGDSSCFAEEACCSSHERNHFLLLMMLTKKDEGILCIRLVRQLALVPIIQLWEGYVYRFDNFRGLHVEQYYGRSLLFYRLSVFY